jgi:hypothetical protein
VLIVQGEATRTKTVRISAFIKPPSAREKPMTNVIVSNQYLTDRIETYHTEACVTVRNMQGKREIEKSEAKAAGLRECSHCTGEHPANDRCDKSIYMAAKRIGEAND